MFIIYLLSDESFEGLELTQLKERCCDYPQHWAKVCQSRPQGVTEQSTVALIRIDPHVHLGIINSLSKDSIPCAV